jgi:PIN domain nuclease of toxin-antitoxin system
MRLLLDTHALLWWFTDDARLSVGARQAIADSDTVVHVSAASAWEIATKQRIGKLEGVPDAVSRYAELIEADGFRHLPISHLHALRAGSWDVAHRDPFDRILAAQSALERMLLVSRDPAFALFELETLW